ncbi:MAG: LTA synthase family protein [Bacteroidales bacterium]|nr:LTA synthase family protein [Bacteroidales bacterium]
MWFKKRAVRNFSYFFSVYLLLILLFTLFRVLLVLIELDSVETIPHKVPLILKAFRIGWRFDTVIACYILILPALLLSVFSFLRIRSRWIYSFITVFIASLSIGAFFIAAVDIPWFNHFSTRITSAVFNWKNSPGFVFKMIIEEPKYFIYFFVFLLFSIIFIFSYRRIRKYFFSRQNLLIREERRFPADQIIITLLMMGLICLGARGRIEKKSPIKPAAAFFSEYSLVNQIALNPDYTFMVSMMDDHNEENRELHLVRDDDAIKCMMQAFGISKLLPGSPIAREVHPKGLPLKANVVVVIMESMSGKCMSHFGNPHHLTPNLDSLANHSLFFNHVYSSGFHTSAGIYATLFSFPNLLNHHPLNQVIIPEFTGLGKTLYDRGYQTIYFTTHDEMFDNIGGFLKFNGYERIVSQKDYPTWQVKSTLGVPDHYMFENAIPYLNKLYTQKKPFLSVFLTASLHDPFIIPEDVPGFHPNSSYIDYKIVEYADWSIGHFLKIASKQAWFDSTIFIFIADHGKKVNRNTYDLSLQYFQIPLIIYSPLLIQPAVIEKTGAQMDVFPTVMGLLNQDYLNNSFGINLLKEDRPFAFFCSDDAIGCVNREFFFVSRHNGKESLYKFGNGSERNYLLKYGPLADSMRNYAFSMLQGSQWLVKNDKVKYGRKSSFFIHDEKKHQSMKK